MASGADAAMALSQGGDEARDVARDTPACRIFPRRAGRYIRTHHSPLHELGQLIQADVLGIEKLDTVRMPPAYEIREEVRIPQATAEDDGEDSPEG